MRAEPAGEGNDHDGLLIVVPARLTIRPLADGLKYFEIDCPHGTTTGIAKGTDITGNAPVIAGLVMKHHTEEGCACTSSLRRQYPVTLLAKTLWITGVTT